MLLAPSGMRGLGRWYGVALMMLMVVYFTLTWYDDDVERPIGPEMGFKDMVRFRKAQGYNCIAMIAAFPNWANDGRPPQIKLDDAEGTGIRSAWRQAGTQSAKDMYNEGGRPFFFPGRVPGYEDVYPDIDRINPAYFHYMDRKVDYLNQQGFIPFIEVARRDASPAWAKFYSWPDSYARYIQYIWTRYQANNCIFSPIHFDWQQVSIPSRAYNAPANAVVAKGIPAFDTLRSCNAAGSSLINFGNADENKWLTLHQIGNLRHTMRAGLPALQYRPARKKPTFIVALGCTAVSCPVDSPGISMEPKRCGAEISSRKHLIRCGRRSH